MKNKKVDKADKHVPTIFHDMSDAIRWFLSWLIRVLGGIFVGFLDFGVLLCMSLIVLPATVTLLSNTMSVGYESPAVDLIFIFGVPVLFMTGFWLYVTVVFIKWLDRQVMRFFRGWSGRVFRKNMEVSD